MLAAARVLRERGAEEILTMGASDGGTATVLAAPDIPELVGLGILSSPKDSVGDAVSAMGRMKDVPAFFAVSTDDSSGNFYPHVEALYNACPSTKKQFVVVQGFDHGTDMVTPEVPGLGYAFLPVDEMQIQKRQELSDQLLLFVNSVFTGNSNDSTDTEGTGEAVSASSDSAVDTPLSETSGNVSESGGSNIFPLLIIGLGVMIVSAAIIIVMMIRPYLLNRRIQR